MAELIPGRVTTADGVVFGSGGGRELRADVFTPPGGAPPGAPGVVIVHGGGWRDGDRTQLRGYGIQLARRGFVAAAIEYRLLAEAPWPAQIHDVKAAIRWMRASASTLGIDPDRIVITGNSAGGHLSLLAAGTPGLPEFEGDGGHPGVSTAVAATLAFYPVTRFLTAAGSPLSFQGEQGPVESTFLFGAHPPAPVVRNGSPIEHVSSDFPPALLIHGTHDVVVPPEHSTEMHAALTAAGVPAELHLFAEQPHGFDADGRFSRLCAETMALFIDRYVVERAALATAG